MKKTLVLLATVTFACTLCSPLVVAQTADMSLTRLDCGTPQAPTPVNQRFSDTFSHGDLRLQFVFSCYLIKRGDEYMLWDTGHAMTMPSVAPKVSIVDQLAQINVKPEQIKYVGISHFHRPYRADFFVSQGVAIDRQRRLGCDHCSDSRTGREF